MSKLFDYVVFDDMIEGTAPAYSKPEFNAELPRPDSLALLVQSSQVTTTATSPRVDVQIEYGLDGVYWTDMFTAPFYQPTLSTSGVTLGSSTVTAVGAPFARLRLQINGATLGAGPHKARIRVTASSKSFSS